MSGIKKRTLFISELPYESGETGGRTVKRFADWAKVITSNGRCIEPFIWNDTGLGDHDMVADLDPTDMMRRVDDIKGYEYTGEAVLLSDSGTVLHEYNNWVRVGP